MLIFLELWNTNEKWAALSPDEQNTLVYDLVKSLEDLDGPGGIEMLGWGMQLENVDQKLPYQLFALWRVPDEKQLHRVERALRRAGWYDYVYQANVAGKLLKSPTDLPIYGGQP